MWSSTKRIWQQRSQSEGLTPSVRAVLVLDDGIGTVEFSHESLAPEESRAGVEPVFIRATQWFSARTPEQFGRLTARGFRITCRLTRCDAMIPVSLLRELARVGVSFETIGV